MLLDRTSSHRAPSRAQVAGAAVVTAGLCAAVVGAAWRVFVVGRTGRWLDQLADDGAQYGHGRLWHYAEQVLDPVSVVYGAIGLVVVVSIAALRRRWRQAVLGALLLGASTGTTQVLKRVLLTRPALDDGLAGANSLPSGHTTAAAATSAALLFVVGPRWRPAVAVLGVVYTVLTGWSTYVGHWHRPSDVLAAIAVVTGWSAVACLLLVVPGRVRPVPRGPAAPLAEAPEVAGRRATTWVLVLLVAGALISAMVVAFVVAALGALPGGLGGASGGRAELLAYGGGVLATVTGGCAMVAVQLALRTAAGRVETYQTAATATAGLAATRPTETVGAARS